MKTAKEILTHAGLDNSHWGQRIIRAEERGVFTADDEEDASSWVTCACGKLDASLMINNGDGRIAPRDDKLRNLGNLFNVRVKRQCIDVAATLLVLIEDRAVELLGKNN